MTPHDRDDTDNTLDATLRILEDRAAALDEGRSIGQPDFAHIQIGATFSPRRGNGPDVTVVKRVGQIVHYVADGKLDFCGAPYFCGQFSLHIPETVHG
jgi:hypothetical protein